MTDKFQETCLSKKLSKGLKTFSEESKKIENIQKLDMGYSKHQERSFNISFPSKVSQKSLKHQ